MSAINNAFILVCAFSFTTIAKEMKNASISINANMKPQELTQEDLNHFSDIHQLLNEQNITLEQSNSTERAHFTKWSAWSRCEECTQIRMKKCVSAKCKSSKIYEERPCEKKRCKRKLRQKEKFHVVQIKQGNRPGLKQGYSRIWSKWSEWADCTANCTTHRYRVCKKPGRCKKKRQTQSAYCYHYNTRCERIVLHKLDSSRRSESLYMNRRYHYNSYGVFDGEHHSRIRWKPKKCGRPSRTHRMLKIIGGTESRKYKWPWHVAVINIYREVFCAGTLIAPRWVLTAGHCIRNTLRVRLNEHNLRATDGTELEMQVRKMYLHPKFNHNTVDNDIAMLKLPRAVEGPIACLPPRPPVPEQVCNIMGWGKVNSSDVYGTDVLHEAMIPVVGAETCRRSYKKFFLTANMFCAGVPTGAADTCAGDSGGGLMCRYNPRRRNSAYTVQGITSFGDGCGQRNKYGIYTMVYNYKTWIRYIIEHYS